MLEDKATLQFILDTTQKIGGAPHNLDRVQEEAVDPENTGDVHVIGIPRQPTCIKLYRYWGIVSAYTIRCSAQIGQDEPCSLGISNKSIAVHRQDSIRPCRTHAVLYCNIIYIHVYCIHMAVWNTLFRTP